MSRDRRLGKELQDIQLDKDDSGVYAWMPDGSTLTHLKGSFVAPPDTPYAGGKFQVDIKIPDGYPFKSPVIKFDTKVWHPNISSQTGAICLDTLGLNWSPVQTIKTALLSLRMLLEFPNPNDPQDAEVAKMLLEDPATFQRTANQWAVTHAGAPAREVDVSQFQKSEKAKEPKVDDEARYQGYNRNLIDRFTGMGFSVEAVVEAFQHVGIHNNNGNDMQLEEAYMGDITARLLGDP